jgi:hypothetical protein
MADLNPDIIQKFEQSLLDSGKSADDVKKTLETLDKAAKKVGITLQDFDKFNKELKRNTTTMGGLFTEMITGRKKFKDLSYALDNLNDDIEEMEEQIEKANDAEKVALRLQQEQLIANRQELQHTVQENAIRKANFDTMVGFGKAMSSATGTAFKTMGGFAKGLQDGSNAFELAGGVMNGAIDGMNAGAQAVGGGMSAAGQAMATSTNPKIKALGVVSQVAGTAIGAMGDAAAAAGKFIVGFMVKQLTETVDAFNKVSASGAMFTDGMTGMVNAAGGAGLTVKQFSAVLQKNSEAFAESGLSVTEGAKQMGRVGKIIKDSGVQDGLLKLGYGFEEQAGLMAEVTANMRRTAGGRVSDQAVAEQTEKYATNLRIIADITGEDAKKKVEQAKQENQILAFQAELAKKSPEQRAQIDAAMATMTEQEKKNFRDRVVLGTVVNKEGAVYEATVKGARAKGEAALKLFENNELTAQSNARLNAQYGDQIKKSVLEQTGMQKAGYLGASSTLTAYNKAGLDAVNQANVYTKDAVGAAKEAVEGQKNATDDLTNNTVTAAKAAQQMAVDLQTLVLPQLSKFAGLSANILGELEKQLNAFEDVTGKQDDANLKVMTFWEKMESGLARVVEWFGELADKLTGGAVSGIMKFFGGKSVQEVKEERVAKETAYLAKTGRVTGPAAATPAPGTPGSLQQGPPAPATGPVLQQGTNVTVQGASAQTTEKSLSAKLTDFLKFGSGTGDEAHFKLLDPSVQAKFIPMAQEYFAQTGKMLHVNSAFRSLEEQANVNSGTNPKAAPGKSLHNVGRALDVNSTQVADLKSLGLLGKYGFSQLPNNVDPPHIQAKDGGIADGPDSGYPATLHGQEAIVPLNGTKTIPVAMDLTNLIDKFNEMIRVLKDHKDISEKTLRATA